MVEVVAYDTTLLVVEGNSGALILIYFYVW